MSLRRAAVSGGVMVCAVLLLHGLRPGLVENGARSPRVWLVAGGVLLAGRVVAAVLRRGTGRPRLAAATGLGVQLVLTAALLAPSFQQRVLVEAFPAPEDRALVLPDAVRPPSGSSGPSPVASTGSAGGSPAASRDPRARPGSQVAAPARPPSLAPSSSAPRLLSRGALVGLGHSASGTASLHDTPSGPVLRFEDVDVEGTPGPVVHLVQGGVRTPTGGVRLGVLKAERGSFSYAVPATVDDRRSWTVLVWCAPYDTPVAAADLAPP